MMEGLYIEKGTEISGAGKNHEYFLTEGVDYLEAFGKIQKKLEKKIKHSADVTVQYLQMVPFSFVCLLAKIIANEKELGKGEVLVSLLL